MPDKQRPVERIAAVSSLALLAMPGAAIADPAPPQPRQTATAGLPALWRDIASVGVTCLIHTPRGVDTGVLHDQLCAAVRAQAARGAPVPVAAAAPGGAALAPGRVTLLVQGGVSEVRGAAVLALSIRAYRNGNEAGQLFAAPPRAVPLGDRAALEAAIRALLADTLPWQTAAQGGARRLPDR